MKNYGKDIIIEMPTIKESFITNLTDSITPMNICEMIQEAVYFENFNLSEQFSFQFKGTDNFLATRHCKIKKYADEQKNYTLIFRRGMESQTVMNGKDKNKLDLNDKDNSSNQQQFIENSNSNQKKKIFNIKEEQLIQQQYQQPQQSYQQQQVGIQIGGKVPEQYERFIVNDSNKNYLSQESITADSQTQQSRMGQRVTPQLDYQNFNAAQIGKNLPNTQYKEREDQNQQLDSDVVNSQRMNDISQPLYSNGQQKVGGELTYTQHYAAFRDPSVSSVSSNYQRDIANSQMTQQAQLTQTMHTQNAPETQQQQQIEQSKLSKIQIKNSEVRPQNQQLVNTQMKKRSIQVYCTEEQLEQLKKFADSQNIQIIID